MLLANAFKAFRPATAARRFKSTGVSLEEAVSSGAGALAAAVGTTFGTYMLADFLSNFLQHPTQLVSGESCVASESVLCLGRSPRSPRCL